MATGASLSARTSVESATACLFGMAFFGHKRLLLGCWISFVDTRKRVARESMRQESNEKDRQSVRSSDLEQPQYDSVRSFDPGNRVTALVVGAMPWSPAIKVPEG